MESGLDTFQQTIAYRFVSQPLLIQGLTHRSHGKLHNERLEFLGDSVLNCVVARILFERYPRFDEGDLSRLRSNLVKQQALYEIAQSISLGSVIRVGEGERRSGGVKRPSILADALEAVVGAIMLDGGFDVVQGVIRRLYDPVFRSVDPKTLGKDAKTLLQEYLQGRRLPLPVYEVVATHGAAHSQEFEVHCFVDKLAVRASGSGGSRRAAEQAAARAALDLAQQAAPAPARRTRQAVPAVGPAGVTMPAAARAATAVSDAPAARGTMPAAVTARTAAAVAVERDSPEGAQAAEIADVATDLHTVGPDVSGPSAVGPSAGGPTAVGPSAVGPTAVGPTAVGPMAVGPMAGEGANAGTGLAPPTLIGAEGKAPASAARNREPRQEPGREPAAGTPSSVAATSEGRRGRATRSS